LPAQPVYESREAAPSSGFHVRKIVREFVPVEHHAGGLSYGQILDAMIHDSLMTGGQIQSLEIEITNHDWDQMRQAGGPTR